MTTQQLLPALLLVHVVLLAAAIVIAVRSRAYTKLQLVAQSLLAILVPVLGAVAVLVFAREAIALPPKPDGSKFDRNYIGSGD